MLVWYILIYGRHPAGPFTGPTIVSCTTVLHNFTQMYFFAKTLQGRISQEPNCIPHLVQFHWNVVFPAKLYIALHLPGNFWTKFFKHKYGHKIYGNFPILFVKQISIFFCWGSWFLLQALAFEKTLSFCLLHVKPPWAWPWILKLRKAQFHKYVFGFTPLCFSWMLLAHSEWFLLCCVVLHIVSGPCWVNQNCICYTVPVIYQAYATNITITVYNPKV